MPVEFKVMSSNAAVQNPKISNEKNVKKWKPVRYFVKNVETRIVSAPNTACN